MSEKNLVEHKMKFTERVNPDICRKILMLNNKLFIEKIWTDDDIKWKDNFKVFDITQEEYVNNIKLYLEKLAKNDYTMTLDYDYSRNMYKHKKGRIYAKPFGLQYFQYKIRGLLLDGIYKDYDMKNAQPTILLHLVNKEKLDINPIHLKEYVNNRENVLVRNNITKKDIYITYNTDKLQRTSNDFLKAFDKEVKQIQDLLYNKYKDVYADTNEKNVKGSLLNKLLCIEENNILQKVISYCEKNNINVGLPMFDGLLIDSDVDLTDTFNSITKEENIKWAIKPHDTSLQITEDELTNEDFYIETDLEGAKYILDFHLKDKIFKLQGSREALYYFFNEKTNLWCFNIHKETLKTYIREIIFNLNIFKYNMKKNTVDKYCKNITGCNKLCDTLFSLIPFGDIDIETMKEKCIGKISFKDGVYDFINKTFTKWNKIDFKNNYFTSNVPHKYCDVMNIDNSFVDKVNDKMWNSIFNDTNDIDFLKKSFARSIAGFASDKRWFTILGMRNSGKSKLIKLLQKSFGSDYIRTFNGNSLLYKKGKEIDAKSLSWLSQLLCSRISFSSEIQNSDAGLFVDGVALKLLSGGDTITIRTNHIDEYTFIPQFTIYMACNDLPDIKPADCKDNMFSIYTPNTFVDNPSNDNEKLIDPNLDIFLCDTNTQLAFVKDIINNFFDTKPMPSKNVIEETESYQEENDIDKLKGIVEVDVDGFIETNIIKEIFYDQFKINISQQKITKLLQKCFKNISKSKKRVNGKTTNVYTGIKLIGDGMCIDDDDEI